MKNWYETFSFSPKRAVVVTNGPDPALEIIGNSRGFEVVERKNLPKLIRDSESIGRPVRAVGSLYSSQDVMATTGVSIEFSNGGAAAHDRILGSCHAGQTWESLSTVLPSALKQEVFSADRRLVHVEASITVRDLIARLGNPKTNANSATRHWCIPNMGASSGQRLIGAISTATHGGAFDRNPLADSVRAIRLIGPGGVDWWIEPKSQAITTLASMNTALPDVEIRYDDELFDSVLVSVGAMGLVVELVLEVAEMFGQSQRRSKVSWKKVCAAMEDGSLFDLDAGVGVAHPAPGTGSATPEGLEILVNPFRTNDDYADSTPERDCWVISRAAASEVSPTPVPHQGLPTFDESIASLGLLPEIQSVMLMALGPALAALPFAAAVYTAFEMGFLPLYRLIIDVIQETSRSDTKGYPPTPEVLETYDGTTAKSPGLSLELAITTADNKHITMFNEILEKFDELIVAGKRYAGFFSIRFTKTSRAHLAMQRTTGSAPTAPGALVIPAASRVCHIEVFGLNEVNFGALQYDGNMENSTDHFFRAFVSIAERHGARLHWGQMHHLDRHRVALDYGFSSALHKWRRSRTRLSGGGPRRWRTFSNSHSRRTGLESYHEAVMVLPGQPPELLVLESDGRLYVRPLSGNATWSKIDAVSLEDVCGPPTAVKANGVIHVFGETEERRIRWTRRSSGGTWSTELVTDLGPGHQVIGPWSATHRNDELHLLGVGPSGQLRWVQRSSTTPWTATTVTPQLPSGAGSFLYSVAATFDAAGNLHVVGLGTGGLLVHGRHASNGWTWSWLHIQVKPFATSPFPLPIAPIAAVASQTNRLHVFSINRDGNIHHTFGTPGGVLDWELLPSIPPVIDKHVEFVTRDKGGDDAYLAVGAETRMFATSIGPLAAVHNSGRLDIVARADTGAILHLAKAAGGGWIAPTRVLPP